MTGIEEVLRAELAREAASLDFTPREEAWTAIQQRAGAGAGARAGAGAHSLIPTGSAVTRRGATIDHSDFGPARRAVLDHLGNRYGRHFVNHWAFVRYAREQNLGLDFTTPPKRPGR